MTGGPLVSVVVPTYRNAAFVEATLESVLAQTYEHLEVVVADHASDDGTWELLQRFAVDPRVRLLRTPAGGGAVANWSRVTAEATGPYLKLVCADDLLAPTCVAEQVAALEAHPGAVLASAQRSLVDARGRRLVGGRGLAGMRGEVPGERAVRTLVRAGANVLGEPACVLLRTAAVRAVGGWSPDHHYLIDEELYTRVLERGSLVALPRTLCAFRLSATQWSVDLAREQARQAAALHRELHARRPDVVRRRDEVVGSARAWLMARVRRAAYVVWRRRMRVEPAPQSGPVRAGGQAAGTRASTWHSL